MVPVLLVLVTFLFWYQTWFGRRLSDREIGEYLTDTSRPRQAQHALAQLAERMVRGDVSAKRWYPQVMHLAQNREAGLRGMAAWVMGQDNKEESFHRALRELLRDPDGMARWNAALALVRFGDASGREELRQMLRPQTLTAPAAGTLSFHRKEAEAVRAGGVVARIQCDSEKRVDVVAPMTGRIERQLVPEGTSVGVGEPVAEMSPGEEQVWESLRALYLVGTAEDLAAIEPFVRGMPGMSDRIRQQATATAEAIRRREPPP